MTRPRPVVVYLGLGSNLSDPTTQVRAACVQLQRHPGCQQMLCSSFYQTPAMGQIEQPDFVNAVVRIHTFLTPEALHAVLLELERAQGRVRNGVRWGPRTLDIDILMYSDQQIETPALTIPHPGLHERAFVLYPLAEIAPNLVVPGRGAVGDLIKALGKSPITRMAFVDA